MTATDNRLQLARRAARRLRRMAYLVLESIFPLELFKFRAAKALWSGLLVTASSAFAVPAGAQG
jgi:hypothetical protein